MSETKETSDKTLTVAPRKPLSLKRTVESGHVRQSFSHGRSKSVVVEKKKKRTISAPGEGDAHAAESAEAQDAGGLSTGELDARRRALEGARERAEAEAREAEEREARRLREEAAKAPAPPPAPTVEAPVEAAPPAESTPPPPAAEPPPPVAAKPEPVKGPIIVVPSVDKPKTDVRRTETVAKRKLDLEPAEAEDEA